MVDATASRHMILALCGLPSEARLLRHLTSIYVVYSLGRVDDARRQVDAILDQGHIQACLSFGIAGALKSDLDTGDIIIPKRVVYGHQQRQSKVCCSNWRRQLLRSGVIRLKEGDIWGSDQALLSSADKQSTKAVAVDMESHIIALAATKRGLPFLVLRAIADQQDDSLPPITTDMIGAKWWQSIGLIAQHPQYLRRFIALGWKTFQALDSLKDVVACSGGGLGGASLR